VGKKPIIVQGDSYKYSSYCEISNTIGRMHGYFNLRNEITGEVIRANIPAFNLEVPVCLN